MARVRVLHADDHAEFLARIRQLLEEEFELVPSASDGKELLDSVEREMPDVVLLDISMPQLNGFEISRILRNRTPDAKIIFLTLHAETAYVNKALELGASGYVLKSTAVSDLPVAIRIVAAGGTYLSPALGEIAERQEHTCSR